MPSNRSSDIPSSFDRFRVTTIQFLSPFRNHRSGRHIRRQSPERSWIRKIQVHPNNQNRSSESNEINHENANLVNASKQTIDDKSSKKKPSSNFFNTRPTSNIVGVINTEKIPTVHSSRSSQLELRQSLSVPTPSMLRYRNASLPALVPTYIIDSPKFMDNSVQRFDFD
ncbi:unnamed protein product [Adineta steineri]|uniref:Uncharacterized protein n=1 Tax=Adineta steineri TaxID=433720 RepID=A0A814MYU3_9BILA|nr:unnamed protein product [Adineta steineri]CAF1085038.1 unnamed protein product [Adineta steineri]CAF1378894.1 unnamed protein product [Adineta steineri]CAF1606886.1 unnamed protein product [Adineta steineri]